MNQFVEYSNEEQEDTINSWLLGDIQDATATLGEDMIAAISEVIDYE
jgi:hypothetical protein